MCKYISATHVQPGYICCECKSYNGLQRSQLISGEYRTRCQFCQPPLGCALLTGTEDIVQCAKCFAGYDKNADGTPQMPIGNLAGRRFNERFCPVCNLEFIPRTPETVNAGTGEAYNPKT